MVETEHFADTSLSNHPRSLPPDVMMDTNANKRLTHANIDLAKIMNQVITATRSGTSCFRETKVSNKLSERATYVSMSHAPRLRPNAVSDLSVYNW
jgi:hypothetical protein|eukprot:evm.model.NODE_7421_length_28612_cov_28.772577.12